MGRQIGRRAVRKPNRSGSPRSAEQLANEPMRYPTVSSMAWRPGELRSASIPDLKITTSTHRLEREQQRLVVQRLVTDGGFEPLSERGRIASSKSERAEVREMARLGHAEGKVFDPRGARGHLEQPNDRIGWDFDIRIKKTRSIYAHRSNQAEGVET